MPEALAVVFVFAVSAFIYVAARFQSRSPARLNAPDERLRLQHYEAWLQERLHRAQREQWDADMVAGIAAELRATSQQLARFAN